MMGLDAAMMRGPGTAPGAERSGSGKSAQSVGHLAKAAVASARTAALEAGLELPRNAQGLAASGIARGADPASIFAGLLAGNTGDPVVDAPADEVEGGVVVPDTGDVGDAPVADGGDAADVAVGDTVIPVEDDGSGVIEGGTGGFDVTESTAVADAAEIALAILEDAIQADE